ncbi:hypothetical protein X760_30665 [Mesorhizobium sp. LSHC422A00]|uniref:WD40 repeat domain-containing protein n=1 Tax=Mesorhizobium sp. LSHC422A00 TaxID=1287294 RepID=UPI0003CF8B0C|nr:WD40 repeat domain-containing protein [Mesorhizobium sp. LSHC422A00]ESX52783.1 hypothetical protein X760_30665 [Mesorhizobium sp. LSHC422A00]
MIRDIDIAGDANGSILVTGDHNVVRVVIAQAKPFVKPAAGENPYRGLQIFEERHALAFFGREQTTSRLWEMGANILVERQVRLMAVLGRSGSGKSSAVRAGLLPALGHRCWPETDLIGAAVFVPGDDPLRALDDAVRKASEGVRDRKVARRRVVVVADQFETLFTGRSDAETKKAFVRRLIGLSEAADGEVFVVVTLRSDFLGALQDYPEIEHLIAEPMHHRIVPGMSREELRDAIAGPTSTDWSLSDALIGRLIEQAHGREGALPLLQYTLTQIWEAMAKGIAPEDYFERRLEGSIAKAIASEADLLFDELGDDRRRAIARRAFARMVELHDQSLVRRPVAIRSLVGPNETAVEVLDVLRHFAERRARLVTLTGALGRDQEPPDVVASVAHEALIMNWPMLRQLLTNDPEDRRFHRSLSEDAESWDGARRPPGSLWRPPNLELLRAFVDRRRGEMTAVELDFFAASDQTWRSEQQNTRRRARLTQVAATIMTCLALAAITASWLAWTQTTKVGQQAEAAASAARKGAIVLARLAERELGFGRARSATLLAAEALPPRPLETPNLVVPQARAAMVSALSMPLERRRLIHPTDVLFVAFANDGRSLITGDQKTGIRSWNAATGELEQLRQMKEPAMYREASAFSPNGQWVLLGGYNGFVDLWNSMLDPSLSASYYDFKNVHGDYRILAFSPDGRKFAAAGEKLFLGDVPGDLSADGTASAHDIEAREISAPSCEFKAAAFDKAGDRIAASCADGTIRIWHLANLLDGPIELRGLVKADAPLVFSHDGTRLAAGFDDGSVRIWDVREGIPNPTELKEFERAESTVTALAFSSDDIRIAAGYSDGTIQIWELENWQFRQILGGHVGRINSLAFDSEGRRLASAAADDTARIWELPKQPPRRELIVQEGYVHRVAFSPDGKTLATLNFGNDVDVWSTEDWAHRSLPPRFGPNGSGTLAFSTDSSRLVGMENINGIGWWDLDGGKSGSLSRFWGSSSSLESLALSRDERLLAIGSSQAGDRSSATIEIWAMQGDKPVQVLDVADGVEVGALIFDATGRWLFAGYADGSVRQWAVTLDRPSGEEPARPAMLFEGHRGAVSAIAIDPDGKRLATAARDGTLRVWDVASGELTGFISSPVELIEAIRFAGGEIEFATLVDGKYVRLWRETPLPADANELRELSKRLRLCPLNACERKQFGLNTSTAYISPIWDKRQLQACGIWDASTLPLVCVGEQP